MESTSSNARTILERADQRWNSAEPSPFRPSVHCKFKPHWRWDLASTYAKGRRIPTGLANIDPVLGRVISYQRGLRAAASDPSAYDRLERRYPDLHEISHIYTSASFSRWTIEALIVSNAKPSEICSAYPISVKLLELYRSVFFDIVDLLPMRNFMIPMLFGPLIDRSTSNDPDLVWKFFAYVGGIDAFQAFIDPSADLGAAQQKLFDTILSNRRLRNAVTAAMIVSPNNWNAIDLQRVHNEFESSKQLRKAGGMGSAETFVGGMLASFSHILGERLVVDEPRESGRGVVDASINPREAIIDYVMNESGSKE